MERINISEEQRIRTVLETHHIATANKDVKLLKDCFAPWAQFVGTDDLEQCSLEEYAALLNSTESGWNMTECSDRSVYMVDPIKASTAMFFEVVQHKKYGVMRGSGVVIKDEVKWKIVQYVLSFSVPNRVIDETSILKLLAYHEPPLSSEIEAMCEV